MIKATDTHLRRRGNTLSWMDQMIQKDTSSVYQSHKVCNKCYEIYEKTEELRKLEIMFAEAMGIQVKDEHDINAPT